MTIKVTSGQVIQTVQFTIMLAILGLLLWSQPWDSSITAETRKITVTGDAVVEAEPDEFMFSPYFQETGTDKDVLKESLTQKSNDVVAKLKEIGVEEKNITIDASSYDYWYAADGEESPMTVSVQVKVSTKELAQKVQDYFQTLDLEGQLTSTPTFSREKQKELEAQASTKATEDARKKAESQANALGSKLGKLIEVKQGSSLDVPIAYDAVTLSEGSMASGEVRASLPVLPGEDEYTQAVTVTYELQ